MLSIGHSARRRRYRSSSKANWPTNLDQQVALTRFLWLSACKWVLLLLSSSSLWIRIWLHAIKCVMFAVSSLLISISVNVQEFAFDIETTERHMVASRFYVLSRPYSTCKLVLHRIVPNLVLVYVVTTTRIYFCEILNSSTLLLSSCKRIADVIEFNGRETNKRASKRMVDRKIRLNQIGSCENRTCKTRWLVNSRSVMSHRSFTFAFRTSCKASEFDVTNLLRRILDFRVN